MVSVRQILGILCRHLLSNTWTSFDMVFVVHQDHRIHKVRQFRQCCCVPNPLCVLQDTLFRFLTLTSSSSQPTFIHQQNTQNHFCRGTGYNMSLSDNIQTLWHAHNHTFTDVQGENKMSHAVLAGKSQFNQSVMIRQFMTKLWGHSCYGQF